MGHWGRFPFASSDIGKKGIFYEHLAVFIFNKVQLVAGEAYSDKNLKCFIDFAFAES